MLKNFSARTLTASGTVVATLLFSGGATALPASAHLDEGGSVSSAALNYRAGLQDQFLFFIDGDEHDPSIRAGVAVQEAASKVDVAVKSLKRNQSGEFVATLERALSAADTQLFLISLRSNAAVTQAGADSVKQSAKSVAGGPSDLSAPVLVSSSVSKTSFNLAEGPAVVTVSVR
ncbi:hypothetical protein LN996_15330, partial [Arthrobacter sp. AK01]|uniref:hypothetical protein n=1 Tax=Arthrobacter sp. AK01 TaxID=2894084 RepID=UPI001E546356